MRKMELFISYLLRYGVLLCALFIAVGIFLGFMEPQYSSGADLPALMQGKMLHLGTPHVLKEALAFHGDAIILVGLFLLIALPIARVALTFILFVLERDWIYVGITLFVLTVLLFSFFLGKSL